MLTLNAGMGLTLFLTTVLFIRSSECAVASSHLHRHGAGREREEDGAFSPRSASHYGSTGKKAGDEHSRDDHNAGFDHEAIIGSAKEAEEFDNLPPEEAKRRLKILVVKMDLDKNGLIERGELKAWIVRSFT